MKPPAPQTTPARNGRDPRTGARPVQWASSQQQAREQQCQDRHGEPACQDRPAGEVEDAGRAGPQHPAHQAGQRPAQSQQLLHDHEEDDDADDVDEQDAGVETVIAEIDDALVRAYARRTGCRSRIASGPRRRASPRGGSVRARRGARASDTRRTSRASPRPRGRCRARPQRRASNRQGRPRRRRRPCAPATADAVLTGGSFPP